MNETLAAKLKYLHLGELLTHWDDYLKLAGDQRFSHGRLLTHIVEDTALNVNASENCGSAKLTFRNPGSSKLRRAGSKRPQCG
jgi:hypothetical protein